MKKLEVQAREQARQDGKSWYTKFLNKAEEAGCDRNVGNMLPETEKDALIPTKLEDHMKNDTICGWNKMFKEYLNSCSKEH